MLRGHGVDLVTPAPAWPLRVARGDRGLDLKADVFGNGAHAGFYFDFTNLHPKGGLSPLYTTNTGETAVSASGNTVGLALSQDSGPVVGSETVVNGGFSTDTDWTQIDAGTGTSSISGGVVTLSGTNSSNRGRRKQQLSLVSGRMYRLTFDYTGDRGFLNIGTAEPTPTTGTPSALDTGNLGSVSGARRYFFFAGSTNWILLSSASGSFPGTCTFDNISIKEVSGNHAYQSTSAARGTWNSGGYWNGDGSDDHLVTGLLPGNDMTIIAAVYPTAASDALTGTIATADTRSLGFGTDASGYATLMLGDASLSTSTIKGSADIRNAWSLATVVGSGLNGTLRVNGVQIAAGTAGGSVNTTIAYLVGAFNSNGTAASQMAGRVARVLAVKRSDMSAGLLLAAEKFVARPNGNFAGIAF